jgi:S-DNA-T family DNA segregation ATPase FtsK/SpoIIIE
MGVVDIPEEQKQQEFVHDFIKDGNIAVFGASGFGKSTAIVNMALSLAVKISPLMLNCFVLDLGNSSLIPLKALPHTADYLGFDDSEKLNKLFRMLGDEIAARKKLFAAENAINFKMYNSVAEKRLPVIVFFIDNYDVVKEMENDAEEHITRITRDGPGLGIYTVITATRSNAVRYAVLNNFKNKLCNFMFDTAEIYSLVGRSQYVLPEIKGRAMVKRGDVCVMQEYLPVAFEDDVSYAAGIRGVVGEISDKCSSPGARGIPMLPEAVSEEALLTAVPPGRSREVAIGLDTEWVEPQFLAPGAQVQLIVGSAQTGKTNILKLVMRQYAEDTIFLADSRSGDLQHYSGAKRVTYMSARAQAAEFIKKLNAAAVERQRLFKAKGGGIRAKDFYSGLPRAGVFIDDIDAFVENCADVSAAAEEAVSGALATGMVIYATTIPSKMRGYDAVTKLIKDTLCGVVTGHPGDQAHLQIPAMRQYKAENSMAFICKSGQNVLVKVPLI